MRFKMWIFIYNSMIIIIIIWILYYRKKGFEVRSFGSGNYVKLPGSSQDKPNIYDFSVSYDDMYQDLIRKDKNLYPFCWFAF